MILSGIHGFKVWIPDYTLGNDRLFIALNSCRKVDSLSCPPHNADLSSALICRAMLFVGSCSEETVMHLFRNVLLVLFTVALLTACATTPEKDKVKVLCPACGTDFDALYHINF